MGRVVLRDRDLEALDAFLEVVAETRSVQEFRSRTVEAVPRVVASEVTAWNEVDRATGALVNPVIHPRPPEWQLAREDEVRQAFATYAHEHPVLQHQLRTGDGRPRAISDFVDQEQFHRTMLYQSCYSVLGTEDQLAIGLPDPALIVAITLTRGWQEFDARDRLLLNLMRPHIVQGLRNCQSFDRIRRLEASLEHHLDAEDEGFIFLDGDGRVEFASPSAARILTRWLGEWKDGVLPQSLADWVTAGTGAAEPSPAAPPWPLMRQRDRRQLTIRRIPSPEDPGTVLVVEDRALDLDIAGTLGRLALTARQAQVLELAIRGRSNASIARELGIGTGTVESHMTQALSRLGVESRTAAANLIFQGLGGTDPGDG